MFIAPARRLRGTLSAGHADHREHIAMSDRPVDKADLLNAYLDDALVGAGARRV